MTQTATDATADFATKTVKRVTLRDSADDNTSMRENVENDLAAARAISTQLHADLAAKEVKLTAACTSPPADVAALQASLDFMTRARDDAIDDERVARTSLSDASLVSLRRRNASCFHYRVACSRRGFQD